MKVFVVDSHAIYRRGLVASLEQLERVDSVDQADGVHRAREHTALVDADIVILDASIAGGCAFITSVAELGGSYVIACASVSDEQSVMAALDAGAVGYLRKDTLTQDLLQAAIHAAEGGSAIIPPNILRTNARRAAVESEGASSRSTGGTLSDREQHVLALIAEGHPTREVAAELCYSERTVKNVLHDVVTKLNARSRSQAVAHAIRDGLI